MVARSSPGGNDRRRGITRFARGFSFHVVAVAVAALVAWTVWKDPGPAAQLNNPPLTRMLAGVSWTRATAYAALALLCLTLVIGPLARLWPRGFGRFVPARRAMGIWAAIASAAHLWFAIEGHAAGNWQRLLFHGRDSAFTMGGPVQFGSSRWIPNLGNPSGIAYWLGLFALAILVVLAAISNDRAQRWLGSTWKFMQRQSYVAFALVLAHFAIVYFNPSKLGWPKEAVAFYAFAAVAALQLAGVARTVWQSHAGRRPLQQAESRSIANPVPTTAGTAPSAGMAPAAGAAEIAPADDARPVWRVSDILAMVGPTTNAGRFRIVRRVRLKSGRKQRIR